MGESQRAAGELEGEEEGRKKGEEGTGEVEKERCSGEEAGDMRGLVWRRHSSSSLFMLSLFFSVLSFSTDSCRLAFSSDSCLQGAEKPQTERWLGLRSDFLEQKQKLCRRRTWRW